VDNKKILIVCRSFSPIISPRSFRATELAKEFARQGNSVKVITSFVDGVDYNELAKTLGAQFKNLGNEKLRSFKLQGSKLSIFFKRLTNRLLLMMFEFPDIQIMQLTANALRDEKGYDLLISVAVPYPVHWGVARARTSKNKIADTWVADCGDPYMGDRIDTVRKLFYFKYIEKWFCRKTDYLTIPVSESMKGYYDEFHGKIRIIPQGFNFSDEAFCGEVFNQPIRFAYAGNIIPVNRDPRPFLDFLCTLTVDFRFIIYTKKVDLIKSYERKLKEKLEIRNYIPRNELLPVLASMDFLVNFDNNTNIHSPSKLIDYAITRRPILNIKSNLDKSAISAFLARDYSKAYIVEDTEQYNISKVAEKFLKLI
jgi:hypothetical protein